MMSGDGVRDEWRRSESSLLSGPGIAYAVLLDFAYIY